MTTSTANAPQTATPSNGQTASNPASAPVAQPSAPEGQPASGQPQQASTSKPSTAVFGDGAAKPADAAATQETAPYALETVKDFDAYDGLLPSFAKVAHGLKVPQETAQKLFAQIAPALLERETQQAKEMHESWVEATRKDPEVGGTKLEATRAGANAALDKVGTPELQQLLIESGLKDHPEILRLFSKIHSLTGADTVAPMTGQKPDSSAPLEVGWNAQTAHAFYGNKKR